MKWHSHVSLLSPPQKSRIVTYGVFRKFQLTRGACCRTARLIMIMLLITHINVACLHSALFSHFWNRFSVGKLFNLWRLLAKPCFETWSWKPFSLEVVLTHVSYSMSYPMWVTHVLTHVTSPVCYPMWLVSHAGIAFHIFMSQVCLWDSESHPKL